MRNVLRWAAVVGLVVFGFVVVRDKLSGPSGLTGFEVQQMVGAGGCVRSDYRILNRLDGSKATLYDCWTSGKGHMCVTVQDGVAQNVTGEARVLFSSALGTQQRPECAKPLR